MDMPLIADYINQVVHSIRFIPARSRVREELTAHFEEQMQFYLNKGCSQEEAENQCMLRIGDAKELSKQFNLAHPVVRGYCRLIARKAASIGIPIFVLCMTGLVFCSYDKYSEPEPRDCIAGEIVYDQEIKYYLTLEDSTYRFTSVVYDSDNTLYLFYHKAGFNVIKNQESHANRCRFYDNNGECYGDQEDETAFFDGVMIIHDVNEDTHQIQVEYQGFEVRDSVTICLPEGVYSAAN